MVSNTLVGLHLLHSLDVLSQLGLQDIGGHLQVLSLLVISLPVEEPSGHSSSLGVVDQGGNLFGLGLAELSGSDSGVDSEDLADEEPESPSHSSDGFEGVRDCSLSVNVGVEDTQDVLEVVDVLDHERHLVVN